MSIDSQKTRFFDLFRRESTGSLSRKGSLFSSTLVASIPLLSVSNTNLLAHNADPNTSGARPASANRVVRAFDFEEQDINPLPVPLGWIRAQEDPKVPRVRPGFPIWNGAFLDYSSPAYSGNGSVQLPTNGGSASLILRRGELAIFPDADYLVSVQAKTDGLMHAKARLVARLLDQQGNPIQGAETVSALVQSQDEWQQLTIEIEGLYKEAAFMQIELQLLQPEQQFQDSKIPDFQVWEQDYTGYASFDNLVIAQLPRLGLSTKSPANIVVDDHLPVLDVLVRDLTGDDIRAAVHIYNAFGQLVSSNEIHAGRSRIDRAWTPELPGFGWYRAVLRVYADKHLVGSKVLEFAWLSDLSTSMNSGMFSIYADLTTPKVLSSVSDLITGAGVNRATLNIWNKETTIDELSKNAVVSRTIASLLAEENRLSVAFEELPFELANSLSLDPDEVVNGLSQSPTNWLPWGGTILDEFGQAVTHWEFGAQPSQDLKPAVSPQLDSIHTVFQEYVPGPMLTLPWPLDRPLENFIVTPNTRAMIQEEWVLSEEAPELIVQEWMSRVQAWSSSTAQNARNSSTTSNTTQTPELGIRLQSTYSPTQWSDTEISTSLDALARRAINFWWHATATPYESDQFSLELDSPWTISPGKRGQVMPTPDLVVWNTLATHLGQRKSIEKLNLAPGVNAMVVGPNSNDSEPDPHDGMIILWLDEPQLEEVVLQIPFSIDTVRQYDIYNNETLIPLDRYGELDLPAHRIRVTRSPILIDGINTNLIRFLNAIKLNPEKLISDAGLKTHTIHVHNPWPVHTRGKIYILEPGGYSNPNEPIDRSWDIKPRVIPFVADPDEEIQLPVELAFSLGEFAGDKVLLLDIEVEADEEYPLIRIQKNIQLGLEGIDMELAARTTDDGVVIVTAMVLNERQTNQDFELIAIAPNEPRIRRSINGIKPRQQVTREFAFGKVQSGDQIIMTLMLRDSSARLNQLIEVP